MEFYATRRGVEISKSYASVCKTVREHLTVAPSPTTSVPRPFRFPVYFENPETLTVPMHWARSQFPFVPIRETRTPGQTMQYTFQGELKESLDQPAAVRATLESLRNHRGAVLSLRTGGGKTCCGLYIACELQAKTLILVHKKFLAEQWTDRIDQFVPGASVSYIQGSTWDTSGDFVIAMVQTLISRPANPDLYDAFKLLIFDEAHHVAAKVFCQSMCGLNAPYTLGLTATPTRKDGLERLIHFFLGPMSYVATPDDAVAKTVTVHRVTYRSPEYANPPPTNVRGDLDYTGLVSLLASDMTRTLMIADLVESALSEYDTLILTHRRAHVTALVDALVRKGLDAAPYIGGTKTIPGSRIIVSTYAYVSEAFDQPRLRALVLATPASDIVQAVGRIMRGDGAHPPVVYDIVDAWGPCYAQAAKRRRQYTAAGFNQN